MVASFVSHGVAYDVLQAHPSGDILLVYNDIQLEKLANSSVGPPCVICLAAFWI